MNGKLVELLNAQVTAEFTAAYTYLGMAFLAKHLGYPGLAHWLEQQSLEECRHAFKFRNILGTRKIVLQNITIDDTWGTLDEVFAAVVDHEREITAKIKNIYRYTKDEPAVKAFIEEMLREQTKEERNAQGLLRAVTLATAKGKLQELDDMAAKRESLA